MRIAATLASLFFGSLCLHAQNLIVNGDFEGGNSGFDTDYVYAPENMSPQGTYCVAADPSSLHGSWASFGDHTTGTGLMLVANGNWNPTNVVWRQSLNIAPDTDYLFSAWGASSYPDNPARFFFYVNSVQQGAPVAMPSTTGIWQNYSVIWSSGASLEVLLEIRMLSTEYVGNDFVLDDLSFRSVSSSTPPPQVAIGTAVEVSWPSVAGQLYQVQWALALDAHQWFSLGPLVAGDGKTVAVYDPLGTNSRRFYRVIPVD